jgi:hypothetical protein
VYVLDYSRSGPDGGAICYSDDDAVCEVAPDLFSRAGFVLRESVDDSAGVNRRGTSVETQHTCMCLDNACRQIAEVRVVDVYDSDEDIAARTPSRHGCVLRRRVGAGGKFTGCAQSLLVASQRKLGPLRDRIISSNYTVARPAGGPFPPTVASWAFQFERDELEWSAHGYRGYVNVMTAAEFDKLPREDLGRDGLEVDFSLLRAPLGVDDVELVTFVNETDGALCASTANWALNAAAWQATTLDDMGRGVNDGTFVEKLPKRATGTERALSIGQALLGLATMYLLLGEVFLLMSELQDEDSVGGLVDDAGQPRGRDWRRRRRRAMASLIFKWPVGLAWLLGLVLLGLEMIAIGVVWVGERNAVGTLGRFVHADFVAAIARDTGPVPFLISERGNVVVVTLIVGTARYTGSNEVTLRVVFSICLALGVAAIVLAIIPAQFWRCFTSRERARRDARARAAASTVGTSASDDSLAVDVAGDGDPLENRQYT